MKAEDITPGVIKAGQFKLHVGYCAFQTMPFEEAQYFEVLPTEQPVHGTDTSFYVNLQLDERFKWFGWITEFYRHISESDLVEYNTYVDRTYIGQPSWKLHRRSIVRLIKMCEDITKAAQKAEKKKARA